MTTAGKEIIKRFFSDKAFEQIKADFKFLIDKFGDLGFEYDLQIRENYFNLYYKGNSIGKVSYNNKADLYSVSIHHKFLSKEIKKKFEEFIHPVRDATYVIFNLPRNKNQLQPFFNTQNLLSMGRKVKGVHYQEEIAFEQALMTDNVNRPEFIIVDRQVMDNKSSKRMDLLALTQKEANEYQFCVIEVKLGNNRQLKDGVIQQLAEYVDKITDNFKDYQECYKKNLKQKQELGIISPPSNIKIVPGVLGLIVVGGYSGIAYKFIEELKERIRSLKVQEKIKVLHLKNTIRLEEVQAITEP
jgi:hypothetical protein